MAGIKEAMKRVSEHRNEGRVIAKGKLKKCSCDKNLTCDECSKIDYLIIELTPVGMRDKHAGRGSYITVYDSGSDTRFADDIELLDVVILVIMDNWSAAWIKKDDLASYEKYGQFSDVQSKLSAPARYRLSELLEEIQRGRPCVSQKLVDELIVKVCSHEGNDPF